MGSRVIFLDIDGVLATNATYKAWRRSGSPSTLQGFASLVDRGAMGLLNAFGQEIGASVVVTSTWRDPSVVPHPVEDVLRASGLVLPISGRTELLYAGRGAEISDYIVRSGLALPDLVVFDDDVEASRSPDDAPVRHGSRVILTSEATGLTPKNVVRARKLFP